MKFLFLFLLLIFSQSAFSQNKGNIIIDLPEDHVDVTSSFNGETITVFGSADQDGDIAVVLRGPETRIAMRKKQPALGMWLNRESVDFKHVPLFYSYAVSKSESQIADAETLRNYRIGLNALNFDAADYDEKSSVAEFQEALIRTQQAQGFFPLSPSPFRFVGQRMFRTSFYLPGNVPVGRYEVEAYLFKDGRIIDSRNIDLDVAQAGLSGNILNFAADYSFAYALFGLLMAVMAGAGAFWMSRSQRS